jgi:hypothetical protein
MARALVQRLPSIRPFHATAAEIGTSRYQVATITWLLALAEEDGDLFPNEPDEEDVRLAQVSAETLLRNDAVLYDCRYVASRWDLGRSGEQSV